MNRAEQAVQYYEHNFNCSQAVFTTFSKEMGWDEELSLKLTTQFGGGARKGELCGAVAGALLVLGLKHGHSHSEDLEEKRRAYQIAEDFMDRFKEVNGSVVCRDLLKYDLTIPEEKAIIMEKGLFQKFCPDMIRSAVEILESMQV